MYKNKCNKTDSTIGYFRCDKVDEWDYCKAYVPKGFTIHYRLHPVSSGVSGGLGKGSETSYTTIRTFSFPSQWNDYTYKTTVSDYHLFRLKTNNSTVIPYIDNIWVENPNGASTGWRT